MQRRKGPALATSALLANRSVDDAEDEARFRSRDGIGPQRRRVYPPPKALDIPPALSSDR